MTNEAKQAIERLGRKAVAMEAGVSPETVRNAVLGRSVNPSTLAKIRDAIGRLGESVTAPEMVNTYTGAIHYIGVGLTCYRLRVRLYGETRYRAEVHYQLRHGETAWHPAGRIEAPTRAKIVTAAKDAARARIEEDRERAMKGRKE